MEINIQSQVGICQDFMSSVKAARESVSIIVSPLKVNMDGESNIRVINGCNMWQACHNAKCHFSYASRQLPKVKSSKL